MISFLKNTIRQPTFIIAAIISFIGIFTYLYGINFLEIIELKTIDFRFEVRGEKPPGDHVVLAVIDEKSLDQEGRWPWPRAKIARLITQLSNAGAKVIAFDIGFHEPDDQRVKKTVIAIQNKLSHLNLSNPELESYLDKLKKQSDNDAILADAIRSAKSRIVLGWFFYVEDEKSISHLTSAQIAEYQENINSARYQYFRSKVNVEPDLSYLQRVTPEPNTALLSNATDYSGFYSFRPDPDGANRWLTTVLIFNKELYVPLSLMACSAFLDKPMHLEVGEGGHILESCIGNEICIPTKEKGQIMINYRGGNYTFPHISVTDILNGKIDADQFRNKIVLVGATAIGTFDLTVTPFSNAFFGPEIHANVIDSVLSKDFLSPPAMYRLYDILVILITGLALGIILSRTGMILGSVISLSLMTGYAVLCAIMFSRVGVVLNMVYPILIMLVIYVGVTTYKYFMEEGQKRFIRSAFSTYLAPAVVKQLIESPEKLELGGEQREITAFFSDVQGFTSISEKLSPGELVELLNEFLTEMTDIILMHEGTVDKFEGDAIIAFFGAPNYLENHAATATRACIEMQKRMAELRAVWKGNNKPELKMRIGLCSGPAVVGNMGSKNRMDYTMMGDTVNTAARLEGVNKVYGIYTLIGETTKKALGSDIITREVDAINVVGKLEPVTVFEPIGIQGQVDEQEVRIIDVYEKGLSAYRARKWDKAISFFKEALTHSPDDGPSKTMLQRCAQYRKQPPDENWNGAYTMQSK